MPYLSKTYVDALWSCSNWYRYFWFERALVPLMSAPAPLSGYILLVRRRSTVYNWSHPTARADEGCSTNMLRTASTKKGVRIETKKLSVLRGVPVLLIARCKVTKSFLAEKVKTSRRRYGVEESSKCIVGRIARWASGPVDERQLKKESISSRDQVVS